MGSEPTEAPLPAQRRGFRKARIVARIAGALALLMLLLGWISTDHFRGFGGSAYGTTLARMRTSQHFKDGQFVNDEPSEVMKAGSWEATKHWFTGDEMRAPTCPLPLASGG